MRPLSPHLTIYRPQITSALSIVHRATGIALYVTLALSAFWVISSGFYGTGGWIGALFGCWLGKLILFPASLALYYHACNGVRHLLWDIGKGLELQDAKRSGAIVLVAAVALTLLTWAAWLLAS